MKFFHVGDLHLGKQLHGYDLIKDQEHMLEELLSYIKKEQPDAVLIAGDIYDRAVPSGTAMQLLEQFFIQADELAKEQKAVEIILIAGNHDAAKRLQYGSSFMKRHHIHIAVMPPQQEDAYLEQVTLTDRGSSSFLSVTVYKARYDPSLGRTGRTCQYTGCRKISAGT